MERIAAAAIKVERGGSDEVLSLPPPCRHCDILCLVNKKNTSTGLWEIQKSTQGFITDSGRFVTRDEAYGIAKRAGQLLPANRPGHTATPGTLYSEDMW